MQPANLGTNVSGSMYDLPAYRKAAWRVVIADDEALPAELLRRMVMRLGHSVVGTAQTGMEALELTRRHKPDVVIMDLRMPDMDGWTAMARLTDELPTPIVVVSALDDPEALEQAAASGASAYLVKPVREDELHRAIDLAMARFADVQEIRRWRADAERRAQELERTVIELREAQLRLANVARRATAASLAQGLAHEINNALTPIIGNAQMIALQHDQQAETVERANQIVENAKRIAGWTASFRQLQNSREQILAFSLNGLIQDVVGIYSERFQRMGIRVQLELDPELPVLEGNPDQLQQVMMNVIQNAVEAMRGGGALAIQSVHESAENQIHLVFRDSGMGIAPEHLAHVFEPGFTTKEQSGQATGLGWGLFTSRQLVQAHHGRIDVQSPIPPLERGTQVNVYLPVTL